VENEIYNIRDTMRSNDRVGVIEVMGRSDGNIALHAGVVRRGGYILVPEWTRRTGYEKASETLSPTASGQAHQYRDDRRGAGGLALGFCDYFKDQRTWTSPMTSHIPSAAGIRPALTATHRFPHGAHAVQLPAERLIQPRRRHPAHSQTTTWTLRKRLSSSGLRF
jgi:hypothetical protein